MRGVEDPQLGLLVQGHVGDELDARSLPGRSTGWELVFQNPLREWLGHDRPRVDDAVAAQLVPVVSGRRRDHAVDHRRGERDVAIDPRGEGRVAALGELAHGPSGGRSVRRQVVAGCDGEGRGAGGAAADESLEEEAGERPGTMRCPQVVRDLGPAQIEGTTRSDSAVTVLGHGDRRDGHRLVGQSGEGGLHVMGRDVDAEQCTDWAYDVRGVAGFRGPLHDVVDEALWREGFSHRCGSQRDAPHGAGRGTGAQDGVAVHRLVGSMEDPGADVDDGWLQCRSFVAGEGHPGGHRAIGRQAGPAGSLDL